jgi:hypothetical protein
MFGRLGAKVAICGRNTEKLNENRRPHAGCRIGSRVLPLQHPPNRRCGSSV